MASRLASSPKWQAVPGGLLALRALRDAGGATFPLRKPDKVYGKIGSLEVRLTRRWRDIKLAQRLRYKSLLRGDVGYPYAARRDASPR